MAKTRRGFLRSCLGGALAVPGCGGGAVPRIEALGRVAPRASLAIAASPFSVGFETLDRRLFDPDRTYPHLARLGVKWARVQTGWSRSEPEAGRYDFAWLDAVVDPLLRIGIQPWFNVGFGNRIYMPAAPDEFAIGWAPVFDAPAREAWVRFARAIAGHFRGRVRHYEIWNEPNGHTFWKPGKPSPPEYVELVRITGEAIRGADPGAVIIGGAVTGMETRFFEECMKAGMGGHVQKVSFHSYRFTPERNYEADVNQWRGIIARHKPGLALWHGEVGAASQPGGAGGHADHPWTEARQAKWLLRRFVSDLRMSIELVSCFHTVDLVNYRTSEGPSTKTNFKGLLRGADYTPKPAYFALQCLCALFDADTARAELPMQFEPAAGAPRVEPGEIAWAAFSRHGRALYAYWHPPGPEMERADETIALTAPLTDGAQLSDPVIVDPLNGAVFKLGGRRRDGGRWSFARAPLVDHPLILTDRPVALPQGAPAR